MAIDGFFLGGVADERARRESMGLKERALGLQEKQFRVGQTNAMRQRAEKAIADLREQAINVAKNAKSPADLQKLLEPLRTTALSVATNAKGAGLSIDPNIVAQQFDSIPNEVLTFDDTLKRETQLAGAKEGATQEARNKSKFKVAEDLQEKGFGERETLEAQGLLPAQSEFVDLLDARDNAINSGDKSRADDFSKRIAQKQLENVAPDLLTDSQAGGAALELAGTETGFLNVMDGVETMLNKLSESPNPDGAINIAGDINTLVARIESNARGLMLSFMDPSQADEKMAELEAEGIKILNEDNKTAQLSAELKSLMVQTAIAGAAIQGQSGRGLSDNDFKNQLRALGEGAGSSRDFAAVLKTYLETMHKGYQNKATVLNKQLGDKKYPVTDYSDRIKEIQSIFGGESQAEDDIIDFNQLK